MSGARPTAPFHVNAGVSRWGTAACPWRGAAGRPVGRGRVTARQRTVLTGYGVLKIFGNWVPGRPAAMSARPESGPNENMNVCVPSAIVE